MHAHRGRVRSASQRSPLFRQPLAAVMLQTHLVKQLLLLNRAVDPALGQLALDWRKGNQGCSGQNVTAADSVDGLIDDARVLHGVVEKPTLSACGSLFLLNECIKAGLEAITNLCHRSLGSRCR